MLKNTSLKEFGYNFLGPLLTAYMNEVHKKIMSLSSVKVFHLAREGHVLKQAFEIGNSSNVDAEYLSVSRTFLFRIMADIEAAWPYSVKHNYKGSLASFFHARFAFSYDEIALILPQDMHDEVISLPDDYPRICDILKQQKPLINELVQPIRDIYLKYLDSVGFTDPAVTPLVTDVGYSGTIQKLLCLLLSRDVHGIYMIATKAGEHPIANSTANIDYVFKSDVKMGGGYTMLDRSMFLEALLTAPNGQFVDILQDANTQEFHFCYGKRTHTQECFVDLNTLHQGALDCVQNAVENNFSYTPSEVESIFESYVTKRNLLPRATWPLFVLDDAISGEGNLNPLDFFGL
ncbi:HAD family hydrolase [Alteromonas sp. C1M14]|uniref:HAD family hydrolase n=1 Tax=Alteromonas sp. C1M14 TaxID=2841567 RepID=UPI001C093B04|nr:HAD family hydrolase [Alteromonas sp. C1M14]MBU2977234.1 HAD family hydrolase [Alteromonas sp. C1M14]